MHSLENANITVIHESGYTKDRKNSIRIAYSGWCRLFTKVIVNQISESIDSNKPKEQGGFSTIYGTVGHIIPIYVVTREIENSREYNKLRYSNIVYYKLETVKNSLMQLIPQQCWFLERPGDSGDLHRTSRRHI